MTTRASRTCSTSAATVAAFCLVAAPAVATSAAEAAGDYARLREGRYGEAVAVPAGGVTLGYGEVTLRLERGSVRLLEATTAGAVTGMVFVGEGRLTMAVADPRERAQLRRMAEDPSLDGVDVAFSRLILRTSLPLVGDAFPGAAATGGEPDRMSRFVRWGALEPNEKHRRRIGPISVGYRAATATTPGGYQLQTYVKGALVFHMLRTLLRDADGSGSDDRFVAVLRDLVARHCGGAASTADLAASLARVVPGDWTWFFDQWVHGTAIPTYAWRWAVATEDGRPVLRLEVEQRDVPAGFRMPVPVRLVYGKDDTERRVLLVDEPRETFTLPLDRRPRNVELNPDLAVLARLEKL